MIPPSSGRNPRRPLATRRAARARSPREHPAFLSFALAEPVGAAAPSRREVNVGVGAGFTGATPQHGIVKLILGREL